MNKELLEYFDGDSLASSVYMGKYAMEGEITPDYMHKRMAKELARIELKSHYEKGSKLYNDKHRLLSKYGKEREFLSENKIYSLFKDFKYIVPQGSIMSQLGGKQIGSLSNCFVIGQPHDSYSGIFQKDQEQVQLMKRRGGVGQDISTLRPEGVPTSNAAKTSTGAVSFMERFSNSTREVAQNGRRGALMLSIDINHPDSPEFATIKNDETKVTGANISIFLHDRFMEAALASEDYCLTFPTDFKETDKIAWEQYEYNQLEVEEDSHTNKNVYLKKVKANELYETIIDSAWSRAEPGQLFIDRFHDYSPDGVYSQYRGVTTNPCGEIFMQPYDACRLMAMNLFSFVEKPFTKNAYFDYDKFYKYNYEMQRLMDDIVDLEIEHIDRILSKVEADIAEAVSEGMNANEAANLYRVEKNLWLKIRKVAKAGRRTGSGITALGDTLAALLVGYGSQESLLVVESIFKKKMEAELDCTTDLAIQRGSFEGWDSSKEFSIGSEPNDYGQNSFYKFILDEFPEQAKRMYKYGRRNVSWSTVAPTGSVSILTQTTSGLEPLFSGFYTRRVKVNPGEEGKRVDFVDKNGDSWMELQVLHHKFKMWLDIYAEDNSFEKLDAEEMSSEDLQDYFDISPWSGSTANDIDWGKRVEIQGVIQKYISHSISSTINLPNDVTKEEVAKIYTEAWRQGLKGVTVYRDGCRSGVLISKSEKEEFAQHDAPKRPKELNAEAYHITAKGERFTVIIGLYDSKPYEVFCLAGEQMKHLEQGKLVKKQQGKYEFNGKELDLNITDEEDALTRVVSISLRHGSNIKYIVEQLNKTNGTIVSFSKAIARALKRYIPEGESSTMTCKSCGGSNVVFEEGCSTCKDCGSSVCG